MDVRRQQQSAKTAAESFLSAPFFAAFIDGALIDDVGGARPSAPPGLRGSTHGQFVGDDMPVGDEGPFARPRGTTPRA